MKTTKDFIKIIIEGLIKSGNEIETEILKSMYKQIKKSETINKFNKKWYSEEEIKEKKKLLENYIGNSRFKISNESLTKLYDKINEIFKQMR